MVDIDTPTLTVTLRLDITKRQHSLRHSESWWPPSLNTIVFTARFTGASAIQDVVTTNESYLALQQMCKSYKRRNNDKCT